MKRKLVAIVLLFSVFITMTPADTISEPLPYREDEFPAWAHTLRRFEIIFLGSVPLSYIFISFGVDTYYNIMYSIIEQNTDVDDVLEYPEREEQEEFKLMLSAALIVSAMIAITDLIIDKVIDYQKSREK